MKNKYCLLLFLTLMVVQSLAQEYESLLGFEHFKYPEVLVITNRVVLNETPEFVNQVDTLRELIAYQVTAQDESFITSKVSIRDYVTTYANDTTDWVLFIHGDGKTLLHAAVRALDIQNTFGVRVIVFAWPSRRDDGKVYNNFKTSLKNLNYSDHHFVSLLDSMRSLKNNVLSQYRVNLSLFLHSLGNEYLRQYIYQENVNFENQELFDNLIINSAAVASKKHYQWVEALNIQKRIYINSNAKDVNLTGLRIISSYGYMVGEILEDPLACNANYINFTEAIGFKLPPGRSHTYYIGEHVDNSFSIYTYYHELFHGNEINLLNEQLFMKRKDGYGYNIEY